MRYFIVVFLTWLLPVCAMSQILLNTDDTEPIECIEIFPGQTLGFEVVKCDADIILFDEDFIPDDSFVSTGATFSHTFLVPGEYSVYCGYRPPGTEVAVLAACITVLPMETVPTTSEWGIIILCLLFMNLSIVWMKNRISEPTIATPPRQHF